MTSPPISRFSSRGSSQRHELSFVEDGEAVAALGLFHQVRGHDHRDLFLVAQDLEILPQVAARAGIEAGGGLVEQQNGGMVEQSLGQFQAALHAAGESLGFLPGAVGEPDPAQHFLDARFQRCAAQAVEMALVPEIFGGGQLQVDALGLEDDADLAAQLVGFLGRVKSHDDGPPAGGYHQGGKDAEQGGLAAAVGPEQAEEFGGADVERNAVQGSASVVAVDEVLDGDHSGHCDAALFWESSAA